MLFLKSKRYTVNYSNLSEKSSAYDYPSKFAENSLVFHKGFLCPSLDNYKRSPRFLSYLNRIIRCPGILVVTSQNSSFAGQPRPMASEANSSFISRSLIKVRVIFSLSPTDGARFLDCLILSDARRDILRPNCRAGALRQAEKRSQLRLRPRIPTFTRLKPSQDRDGPPCQVWGRWDQWCGRASITYTHTFDIYM